MSLFGESQNITILPIKTQLSDSEWYAGLEELCPIEKPDIRNPGNIKPLSVAMRRVLSPVCVDDVEKAKLGRGFLNLFQVVAHLILYNRHSHQRSWLGAQASDGTFMYLRMLMPNPASPKKLSYTPFMAAMDCNYFGLSCCTQQERLQEGDLLLFAA